MLKVSSTQKKILIKSYNILLQFKVKMSDFVPEELWEEILTRHWSFFDTEESIAKLEKRKKLEGCLKEFLCIVHHDRKFFLVETANILKNSILNLENFSAQKAITAFESISQYANNLFTKPWRKEFRILKMYSGFYQHEIKSNLLDAEILFEAMGYRRLSEDTLILDGPICPDQVTNVSRDSMTAYVELQIIKHIYTSLEAIGVNCSWLDIYRYREKHAGGASQAIKGIAYSVEEKRFRSTQKALVADNYGFIDVQPSPNYFATSTQFCPAQCQCHIYQQDLPISRHRLIARPSDICCVPEHHKPQSSTKTNSVYGNMSYPTQHHYHHHHPRMSSESGAVVFPQMSHSRSLEHYSETANHNNMLPHRHSFDHQQQGCSAHHQYHHSQQQQQQQQQQQNYYQHAIQPTQNFYESPYDCIDGNSLGGGSSTISYTAVAANVGARAATIEGGGSGGGVLGNINSSSTHSHPYNVSGNRFPLPINISNQLSAYDNLPSTNYYGHQEPTYALISEPHMYSSVSKIPQNLLKNTNDAGNMHGIVEDSIQRQRSCQSEQLINFEDSAILTPTAPPQQQFDPSNQYRKNFELSNQLMDKHYNMRNIIENTLPLAATSTCQQHCGPGNPPINDIYVYAKPTPRVSRKSNASNLREYPYNTDMNYESANDDFSNVPNGSERNQQSSPTQFKKNQDGVGSSEYWSYVFQELKKNPDKDLCEKKDFLVQSLNLDSLNINNDTSPSQSSSAEKRRSYYSGNENKIETQQQQLESKQKSKAYENSKTLSKNNTKMETSVCTTSSTNNTQKKKTTADTNVKKIKSALKQNSTTSKTNTNNVNKTQPKTNDNKTLPKAKNNNNNDLTTNFGNGTTQRRKLSTSVENITKKSPSAVSSTNAPPPSTQNIVTSANEWSCIFCTFINPDTKNICEICSHTKDFKLDSPTSSTATGGGGASLAHNMPTCA